MLNLLNNYNVIEQTEDKKIQEILSLIPNFSIAIEDIKTSSFFNEKFIMIPDLARNKTKDMKKLSKIYSKDFLLRELGKFCYFPSMDGKNAVLLVFNKDLHLVYHLVQYSQISNNM